VESVLTEWLSLVLRWLHVIAGIGWIGSSFYFIHLDLSLKARSGLPDGVQGDAWQVHGGGFYHMVKYLVAPARMPDELTWFKWEAYATWLSGFALLVVVYYLGAELYLIDKSVLDPTLTRQALGTLLLAAVLRALCRSPLGRRSACSWATFFSSVVQRTRRLPQIGALVGTWWRMSSSSSSNQKTAPRRSRKKPDQMIATPSSARSTTLSTLPVVFR
jgi:uncharacterized membrane protein